MKKYYLLLTLAFISYFGFAQNYNLGIVHISNYDFKIIAIPDFTSTGDTDVSDIGFTIVLPTGVADATSPIGLLSARPWTVQEFDAAFLTGIGLGDGSKDVFQFNLPPGQSVLAHNVGDQIDLVRFSVTNSPTSGNMSLLLNSDPIAMGAGGVLDSFYNTNLGSGTLDYFLMPQAGLDSFIFTTLSTENSILDTNSIQIYPNPADTILNISISDNTSISSITLYNLLGKKVLTTTAKTIDVSSFQTGMYLLKIETEKGQVTKRIVIQ
ncbi:T9SS type A sorting domain-containing protein [Lacinutrix himadriensis]|uniref:T9SS type A sorting domain-containing protein n=1 Tax=Lacinutrix himadriensis TaxID=641549 RepID=UPI0006E1AE55|nr:T9SS type A sorting domain-containing protein [Lacinutrix himadriensis]